MISLRRPRTAAAALAPSALSALSAVRRWPRSARLVIGPLVALFLAAGGGIAAAAPVPFPPQAAVAITPATGGPALRAFVQPGDVVVVESTPGRPSALRIVVGHRSGHSVSVVDATPVRLRVQLFRGTTPEASGLLRPGRTLRFPTASTG